MSISDVYTLLKITCYVEVSEKVIDRSQGVEIWDKHMKYGSSNVAGASSDYGPGETDVF